MIYSLPEGYKGVYDPYIPPFSNHSDQSEVLFDCCIACRKTYAHLCMYSLACCSHTESRQFTQIQEVGRAN